MLKIKQYLVISETGTDAINQAVNQYIQKGWQPIGGVSVSFANVTHPNGALMGYEYAQAMVLDESVIRADIS